jgi:colicin import membrane protein
MKNLLRTTTVFNIPNTLIFAIFIIAFQAINTPAAAQIASENTVNSTESNFASDLNKIKQEKLAIEAKSKEQEAACYKKFAVSSCLKDVKTEKLAALNEVKRRELELNNQQRSQKAKAVQEKQEKRESSRESSNAASQSKESPDALKSGNSDDSTQTTKSTKSPKIGKSGLDSKTRSEKLPADEQRRVNAASKRAADVNQKLAASQKKAQLRANKQSQSSAQAASYAKKLQLAEAHKNDIAQKQAAKTKPKSAPLPIPSAAEIAR